MDKPDNPAQKFAKRIIGILGEKHQLIKERRIVLVVFALTLLGLAGYRYYQLYYSS